MTTFTVTAEKLLYGGDALARRDDGKAVFIPFAVPGDRLLIRSLDEKKNYIRAEILEILTPGDGRVTPVCPHFGKCGGCHWQQVEYSRQVEAKRLILEETFHHRFPETRHLSISMRQCAQPFGYRSRARVRLQTRDNRIGETHTHSKTVTGFFRGGSHEIEDIESCPLFRSCLNDALTVLRRMSFKRFKSGTNDNFQEINIACSEEEKTWTIAKYGYGKLPGGMLRKSIGGFVYNVSAETFFQANDFMTDALVSHVMDCVPHNSGTVLDLFSGVGLFSLPLARRFRTVTAVEQSIESHRLCAMNAAGAGIKNLETVCADAAMWLNSQPTRRFDCVVLDPPRAGADPVVMEHIGRLKSAYIVYVSCDPKTLARDIERIASNRLRIVSITGFDMFPQTYHFETIVVLEPLMNV